MKPRFKRERFQEYKRTFYPPVFSGAYPHKTVRMMNLRKVIFRTFRPATPAIGVPVQAQATKLLG